MLPLPDPVPPMSQSALQRPDAVPATMPPHNSHCAPYFSGQVCDPIEDFLDEYEELANCCGLTERQKVERVIRYIPFSFRDLWKSLDGYRAHDWTDFRRELEDIYEGPSFFRRNSEQKLLDFVRHSSETRMSGEEDVLHYYRQFLALSKPLLDSKRLTTDKRNKRFWCGFHSKDRAEMFVRLIAKHPRQPTDVYFDYLEVYKVARLALRANHVLDVELDDSWDEPRSLRGKRSDSAQERWLDQEERDPRGADLDYRTYERRRHRSPIDFTLRDTQHQRFDARRSPLPETETKAIKFKEPTREEEDRELEDLIRRMHKLSTCEESYAVLFAQCAHRFPTVAQNLPKPVFPRYMASPAPAATFSLQVSTPPTPPTHHLQPVVANPPLVPQFASDPSSFFRPRARIDG